MIWYADIYNIMVRLCRGGIQYLSCPRAPRPGATYLDNPTVVSELPEPMFPCQRIPNIRFNLRAKGGDTMVRRDPGYVAMILV